MSTDGVHSSLFQFRRLSGEKTLILWIRDRFICFGWGRRVRV